jgi:hypothetical protein
LREVRDIYIALAVWLILIIFLSFGIKTLWSKYAKERVLNVFLYPGTIVHECSHAIMCLVTGATITEFNLLRLEDVKIKYDRPKIPVFGDFLIVFAPIAGCAAVLIAISFLLDDPVNIKTAVPKDITFTAEGFFAFSKETLDTIRETLFGLWDGAEFKDPRWVGFMIATIIFTVSMAPQKGDMKYLIPGIVIIALTSFFVGKYLGFWGTRWFTDRVDVFWAVVNLAACMLLTFLFLSAVGIGIYQAVKLTANKKRPGG